MDFSGLFEQGLGYHDFLKQYANENQRSRWQAQHQKITLTPDQQNVLSSFRREMKVMVLAGAWCGDCVAQCPIFNHFAETSDRIRIRYFDRDTHTELSEAFPTCGGNRVPTVLFFSEDDHFCGQYGDRTLAKYRSVVSELQGVACPSGIVLDGGMDPLLKDVVQDWLNEFERIQLMLRISPRLRNRHGD